jgi:hypothetical protein
MEKKQTAVDTLIEILVQECGFDNETETAQRVILLAKKMEKEQIEMACNQQEFEDIDGLGICETISKGEQYYNETYGETKN